MIYKKYGKSFMEIIPLPARYDNLIILIFFGSALGNSVYFFTKAYCLP